MLTANRLEKIMELEENLRAQYQDKLDARERELDALRAEKDKMRAELQATIDRQLEQLKELSGKAAVNDRAEQQNRELTNRSEKQATEIADLKKRVKGLQKDLQEVREENKVLNQYDPPRMKKNLAANKKKLAEQTKSIDTLQKSLNQAKRENADLEQKIKELEAQVAALTPADAEGDQEAATDSASSEKAAA